MTKKEKRELLATLKVRLSELYPDAICALNYEGDPWRLLIMTRLSAQCTDARVNEVCKVLFAKYPNAEALSSGELSEIGEIIRPCGLWRKKAENIKETSKEVIARFGGRVPDNMDELLSLPGVGRKTANLVLGDVYGKSSVVCDTHFMCIMGRLGFYPEELRDAGKIEKIVLGLSDMSDGSDFCHRIVTFGREFCTARNPACEKCPIADICRWRGKV